MATRGQLGQCISPRLGPERRIYDVIHDIITCRGDFVALDEEPTEVWEHVIRQILVYLKIENEYLRGSTSLMAYSIC